MLERPRTACSRNSRMSGIIIPCSYILPRVIRSCGCLRTVRAGSPRVIPRVQMWMARGNRSVRPEPRRLPYRLLSHHSSSHHAPVSQS
jgi:hypothetical protein